MRLQVYVSDELGGRIAAQAEKDRRSVSEWVALVLEDRFAEGGPGGKRRSEEQAVTARVAERRRVSGVRQRPDTAPMEGSFHPLGCPHDVVEKRTTSALGARRYCVDCGALLP